MKRHTIILVGLLLSATALLSFGILTNDDHTTMTDHYETLWAQFKENLNNQLPESAGQVLDSIEHEAERDHNQVQLLKTILYRRKVMHQTVEEAPDEAYVNYALAQLDRLDTVPQAVLHCEIARLYGNELDNKALADEHFALALQPVEQLKADSIGPYICLYESGDNYYKKYEPTLFDFLVHRVANHYRSKASADNLQSDWDTQSWWLPGLEFAQLDFGDSDNPILRCLRFYQQLILHNQGDETLLLYNDYKRLGFVNSILKEEALYQNALLALMEQYRDNRLFADLSNSLAASLISQYQEHPDDSAYHDNYVKAAAICQAAIDAYPTHCYDCQSTLESLKKPEIKFTLNEVQLPNENIPAVMEYRNLTRPYYKIVKVSESKHEELQRKNNRETKAEVAGMRAYREGVIDIPAETDMLTHTAIVALPPLENGVYYLLGNIDPDNQEEDQIIVMDFQVSRLGFLVDSKPNQFEIVTIDRKTGHPLAGVTVEVFRKTYNYQRRKYQTTSVANLVSDANGHAVLNESTGHDSFYINLRKGGDVLLAGNNYYLEREPYNSGVHYSTCLFTDRAIYRPGQTVHFKGIVVRFDNGEQTLSTRFNEEINFSDANWQNIASHSFTTDDYGSFSGSFVIPTDLLNGTFHLNGRHGSATIRVEEYKRPSFEINFESVTEQYKLNEDVTIHGSVDALAGFGLDDVKYSYRVTRKTSFPWRCWWWWYPAVPDVPIDCGEARTDENGKFAFSFNLKPSLKTKPEQQPVFTYEIVVTATSAQGETHSSTHYLRAGYNEVALSTNLPTWWNSRISENTASRCST